MVERIDNEGTDETGSQEDDGVDETNDPLVLRTFVNTKLLGKRQICTVRACLVVL